MATNKSEKLSLSGKKESPHHNSGKKNPSPSQLKSDKKSKLKGSRNSEDLGISAFLPSGNSLSNARQAEKLVILQPKQQPSSSSA